MQSIFLEFEKPIAELEAKIEKPRHVGNDSAVTVSEENPKTGRQATRAAVLKGRVGRICPSTARSSTSVDSVIPACAVRGIRTVVDYGAAGLWTSHGWRLLIVPDERTGHEVATGAERNPIRQIWTVRGAESYLPLNCRT